MLILGISIGHGIWVLVGIEFDEYLVTFDINNSFVLHDTVFVCLSSEVTLNVLLIFNPLNEVGIGLLELDLVYSYFTRWLNCE